MVVVPQVKCSLTRCTRSFSHRFGPCRCLVADAQVLRSVATLSTTIMYIPLVSTVIGVYNCSNTWEMTGWTCFAGAHLALAVGTAVVILTFSCFSFVGELWSSRGSLASTARGRVAWALILVSTGSGSESLRSAVSVGGRVVFVIGVCGAVVSHHASVTAAPE